MVLIGTLLAVIFLMTVLRWWSEGIYEASDAILLAAVFSGLIFGVFAAQHWWQFLMAFIPLTASTAYLAFSYKLGSSKSFYKRQCEQYARALHADPRNLAARERLAEALYNTGDIDRAIDELQAAVDLGAGVECRYRLNVWVKDRDMRDRMVPVCKWCHTENPQGVRKCCRCGSELPFENSFSRWLTGGRNSCIRYYLLIIVGFAVAGTSFMFLPWHFAVLPTLMFVLALAGWSLVASARG